MNLHENTSEKMRFLSEDAARDEVGKTDSAWRKIHVAPKDLSKRLHETKSEYQKSLHEIKTEFREIQHEITSEFTS